MGKYEAPRKQRSFGNTGRILVIAFAVIALLTAAIAVFGTTDRSKHGLQRLFSVFSFGPKEIRKEKMGIDVARYQGTIDWESVAQSDIDFAMIRLGYRTQVDGEIVEDSNARYNLQEASRNGLQVGGYFFSSAVNPDEAREEAAWVADLIAQYPITYPIAYNCEGFLDPENRNHGLSAEERTTIAFAFLEAIEEHGYEGMFYASRNELEDDVHWIASDIQKDYKIWVAQYTEPEDPREAKSDYTGEHSMWQYTALGEIPGVPVNADLNISYFGYNKAKKPLNSTEPEPASPDPESLFSFDMVNETVTAKEETNLRSLPSQGPESQVLYTLHHGETAQRLGVSDAGWSKLFFDGNIYYAVSNFLTTDLHGPSGGSSDDGIQTVFQDVAEEEVTAKDAVNLRSLPSVKDPDVRVVGQLKKGDIAIRTGISSNGWSRLKYQDMTCYAVSSYLVGPNGPEAEEDVDDGKIHTQFEPVEEDVTPKDAVNLRTRPTVQKGESEVIVKLKHGQVIKRTGINRDLGWSRVVYEDQELYCISKFLESAEPSKRP